jgi:hypothetical protein
MKAIYTLFRLNKLAYLVALVLLCLSFLKIVVVVISDTYDWDIDHMMYFGGRLLEGELVWTREFEDKFPFVQILFLLPAIFESIQIWKLMSLVLMLIAAKLLFYTLKLLAIRDWKLTEEESIEVSIVATSLFLYLLLMLPGSLTHINPAAASFLTITIALRFSPKSGCQSTLRPLDWRFFIAAFCASAAISIRPYFLFPVLLIEVWLFFRKALVTSDNSILLKDKFLITTRQLIVKTSAWAFLILFFGIILNASLYIVSGKTAAFLSGLELLSQKLNPQEFQLIFKAQLSDVVRQLSLVLILIWFALIIIFFYGFVRKNKEYLRNKIFYVDIIFGAIISPILLELTILSKHYWSHYQQMFAPYAAIVFALFFTWVLKNGFLNLSKVTRLTIISFCFVAALIITKDSMSIVRDVYRLPSSAHPLSSALKSIEKFLVNSAHKDASFLHPSHMYLHWKLNEPRHGFPHAGNTTHIIELQWWENVNIPKSLFVPTNRETYCELLRDSGPRFVFDFESSSVLACFDDAQSQYNKILILEVDHRRLFIFERK